MPPRLRRLALWCCFSLALALRLWGIGFGEGQPVVRPDEQIFALEALGMFSRPYARFWSGWPSGFFELFHAIIRAERLFWPGANFACLLGVKPLAVYLPVRVVCAVLGAATVFPVYAMGSALKSTAAGLFAAAAYAVNYLVIRDGHFAVSDTACCLAVALCLWACVRGVRDVRWLAAAGAFAGAAFSIKYAAAPLIVPCAVAAFTHVRRDPWRAALLPAAAALAAFLLLSPAVLLDLRRFFRGIGSQDMRYGHPDGLAWYGLTVLPAAFGWPGFTLAVCGLGGMRRAKGLPALAYALVFFTLVLAPVRITHVRYAGPLVPALAVGVGLAVAYGLELSRAAGALLLLAALAPPALRAAQFDHLLSQPDTRQLASRWLLAHPAPVESLGGWAHVHALEHGAQEACAMGEPVPVLAGESRPWTAMVARGLPGWEPLGEALVTRSLNRPPRAEAQLLSDARPLWGADDGPPAPPIDPACWPELVRFSPGSAGAVHDVFDAFFVPFAGFAGVEHPGPEIVVRRRACEN